MFPITCVLRPHFPLYKDTGQTGSVLTLLTPFECNPLSKTLSPEAGDLLMAMEFGFTL